MLRNFKNILLSSVLAAFCLSLSGCGGIAGVDTTRQAASRPLDSQRPGSSQTSFTMIDGSTVSLSRQLESRLEEQGVLVDKVTRDKNAALQSLPTHVAALIGSDAQGPNCFNLALFFYDKTIPLRTEDPVQLGVHIQTNMTPLAPGDVMEPGDLLTVWQTFFPVAGAIALTTQAPQRLNSQLRHAAVYLGGGWVVEKPGIEARFGPYQVVRAEDALEHYWQSPSFPTGFIGTQAELDHYAGPGVPPLPPTVVVFRPRNKRM